MIDVSTLANQKTGASFEDGNGRQWMEVEIITNMRHITCVENIDNLRALVKQDLRELGIKVPKVKKSKKQGSSKAQNVTCDQEKGATGVFGNYLAHASCIHVADCGYVPRFLVDASDVILENVEQEGLFRKSGAVSRQKELKYFRELPEPLFTSVYHDAFIKCFQLGDNEKAVHAVFLLTLLLPGEHLSTLRYVMKLLSKIASHSEKNKMDPTNLAVVLAPNIMHINSKSEKMNASEEKLLQWQTGIVELLIHSADSVGMVSDSLYERTSLMTEAFGTDDDLDASEETLEESRGCKKKDKRRKRRLVSSIAQSITKWRRSTDGKAGNMSQTSNISQVSNTSHISAKQNESNVEHGHPPLPPGHIGLPTCTPVLMRKRKASAILQNLPNQATLANTPFTPASAMKRTGTLNTPIIQETPVAFSATPSKADKNNSRKRINLFSPASARKGKKVVSSTNLSIQSYGKKGKSKGLFRRLSGGKGEKLQESTNATKAQVGQRLASPEGTNDTTTDQSTTNTPEKNIKQKQRSDSDKSPIAALLQNSAHSPSGTMTEQSILATEQSVLVTEQSVLSVCDDRNSLNEGFIMLEDDCDVSNINADNSHLQNSDIVRNCVSDLAINVSVNDSHVDLSYRHSFCAESDASRRANLSLRRGKPNSIKAGLLQGEQKRVGKLRRSFGLDKSDISDPIPVVVPPLPQCLDTKNLGNEEKTEVKNNSVKLKSDISVSKINGNLLEVDNSEDKKTSAALITDTDNTQSQTKSEDGKETSKQITGTTNNSGESETGFSTVSDDTFNADQNSNVPFVKVLAGKELSGSIDLVQNQANEDTNKKYPKMQTVDSTDSLLSGQIETSPSSKSMSRSISTDSGKGSMFDESGVVVDNCETGKQQISINVQTEEGEMET
ncbi:hypothetical protein KUTeg_013410 [Tegillarca granosa]|uniref:Rho-GAP domain-containing protein n=1 Tax=Tegillarca granosa TaxID=220873 RepID=A0ABQ9EW17_TEGGR|nr:hypothetical protein KUTeg_013410 [Tegillarca granosa]